METIPGANQARVTLHRDHNLGVAVDTPRGLLVPVVRKVQEHTLASLAEEILRLSELARTDKLEPKHFQGATFMLSNIGSLGGDVVAPVLVPPMVSMVAVGRIRAVPTYTRHSAGQEHLAKQEQVTLSWSADHRLIDGATVARAAQKVEQLLRDCDGLLP